MIDFSCEHVDRHVRASAVRSDTIGDLVAARYDYVLIGSSWDERCTAISAASELTAEVVQLFCPLNRGEGSLRDRHDELLVAFSHRVGAKVDIIESASEDLSGVFDNIESTMLSLRKELNRPLRVLVDLSPLPRYFSLGAVALCLNDGFAEFADVLYSEGIYGESAAATPVEVTEQTGTWEAIAIPRMEGDWYPTHDRHFLISVGFEPNKAARLADRWDPDRITVLFPSPGVRPEYEERARERNSLWMEQFDVTPSSVIEAPASNAVEAWTAIATARAIDPLTENVYCLLSGSKPHSLGLALYALSQERPALMYIKPTTHVQTEVSPNGVYWRYRLFDRSLAIRKL